MEHWKRCGLYDASKGVPYRAYAYLAIQGAVLMSCRRKEYRESTHEELGSQHTETREGAEAALLKKEERRNVSGPKRYRQLARVREAIQHLSNADAYLIRRVLIDGCDSEELCEVWKGDRKAWARRLQKALAKVKRGVG